MNGTPEPQVSGPVGLRDICPRCLARAVSEGVCLACMFDRRHVEPEPDALQPGTVLNGRFFVGLVLGQGGFGITYKCIDLGVDGQDDTRVAIKEYMPTQLAGRSRATQQVVPRSGKAAEFFKHGLQRFREEAETLASFEHPSIVKVTGYFETFGTGYLVMPYLEGITLAQYLDHKGGRIPFTLARDILVPVMDALGHLHRRNVLHRDVSPDNIYLTLTRRVILIDFGAARNAIGESTHTVLFKEGYAPLEMYLGRNQGAFTDIYSLGATLYRACTGLTPPPAPQRSQAAVLMPPSRLDPPVEMSSKAEKALMKALELESAKRFSSVSAFQLQLFDTQGWPSAPQAGAAPIAQPGLQPTTVIAAVTAVVVLVLVVARYFW
ncbi:MAG: serine/threonine-protein kinase [Vicinamibacterales bacterium]